MGHYEQLHWEPAVVDGVPRADRRRGAYRAYVPDLLAEQTPLALPAHVVERVAAATAALTAVSRAASGLDLDGFVTLALRSEAVGSSVIEGVAASARTVAVADLTSHGGRAALEVARAVRVLRHATTELAAADTVTVDDVVRLQSSLIPHLPGIRREQVWIGGANPIVATYVAPAHARLDALLQDLLEYLNDPSDAPVVAAAVVHAQFETIHPFRDGNGRVGRALTQTVLARAAATGTVVPFSRVLAAQRTRYFDGLTAWRTDGGPDRRHEWIELFADALVDAAALADGMAARLRELQRQSWERVAAARHAAGRRPPRRGSATQRLLDGVIGHPVDTVAAAAERLHISTVAARDGLDELTEAGVYATAKLGKGKSVTYLATKVLALADLESDAHGVPESVVATD